MANDQCIKIVSLPAGADLTGAYLHALTIDATGRVVSADAATEFVIGILAEAPTVATIGFNVSVMLIGGGGIGKCVAQAAITAGHVLIPTATAGKVAGVANIGALVADQMSFGIALEAAAAADQIISFLAMTVAAPHVA